MKLIIQYLFSSSLVVLKPGVANFSTKTNKAQWGDILFCAFHFNTYNFEFLWHLHNFYPVLFIMIAISLLKFSFCYYIIFPILLNSLSIFSCISLNFLKIAIWILYLIKADLHDSGFIYQKITMIPWWYHVTLIFHSLCSVVLFSSYLKEQSLHPVFTECLQKRNTFHCPC